MIIDVANEEILGNGAKSSGFTIQASAKAFKILSSDLYTHKIRAIVRELSTNALDAHALNGFTGKFYLKCPTQLDPRFIVRDFGPGMSDFQIRGDEHTAGLYNSYFASTKTGSNDFIGGFGLGSKSPFSYTDTFNITSYHNGEVRGYVAYNDNNGPQIKPTFVEKMGPEDKTGVEVVVPATYFDLMEWKTEIEYILRPFGEVADIAGMECNIEYFPEFEEYYAAGPKGYGHPERYGLWAIYGGIVYPLDTHKLAINNTWLEARHSLVYIKFPMGELDIAPSREALSLDKRTMENIQKRVKELDERAFKEDTAEWREAENVRHTFRAISNLNHQASQKINHRANDKWTAKKLTTGQMYKMFNVDNSLMHAGVCYEVSPMPKLKRLKNSSNSSTTSINKLFGINAKKIYIVIDDCKKDRLDCMRALSTIQHGDEKATALAEKHDFPARFSDVLFVDPNSEIQMNILPEILKMFEGDTVHLWKTSELRSWVEEYIPAPVKREYQAKPKAATAVVVSYADGKWTEKEEFWCAADAAEYEGYVAFMNNRNFVHMDSTKGTWFGLEPDAVKDLARRAGITEYALIRPTIQKRIIKENNCDDILDVFVDMYINAIDEVDYDQYIYLSGRSRNYTQHTSKHPELAFMNKFFMKSEKGGEAFGKLQAVRGHLDRVTVGAQYTNSVSADALRTCNRIYDKLINASYQDSNEFVKEFEEKYPVIAFFMSNKYTLKDTEVAHLVKLMKDE